LITTKRTKNSKNQPHVKISFVVFVYFVVYFFPVFDDHHEEHEGHEEFKKQPPRKTLFVLFVYFVVHPQKPKDARRTPAAMRSGAPGNTAIKSAHGPMGPLAELWENTTAQATGIRPSNSRPSIMYLITRIPCLSFPSV
jgi:hypothetical protein